MINILLISESSEKILEIEGILKNTDFSFDYALNEADVNALIEKSGYDIILADTNTKNLDITNAIRKIKSHYLSSNAQILLLTDGKKNNPELSKLASGFILQPCSNELFLSVINSSLRTKNSLDILGQNNTELAKSLYQLDVLYKTSTQLAGSLDKDNLILSMIDGVDRTLSFDISYLFLFDDLKNPQIVINSIYPLTETLVQAIKLRALLNFKEIFAKQDNGIFISGDSIKVEKNIKQQQFQEFDLKIFRYDSLLTEIKCGNATVGLMEVFRKKHFAQDDSTCFQTLSKQVAIPLESASLYEELKETNIKLEKLERLKSEFISIVSHELRTPLTALKNALDIILTGRTGEITASMEKFLDMAKRNSVRLSGIINDLLDLSKVEAGKMEFRFASKNIFNSIEYVKNTLENLAKEKNINISLNCDENYKDLYIDSQRIEQVITNLLSNAIKFTPENGEINIYTKLITEDELKSIDLIDQNKKIIAGDYLEIAVKDNGIGIKEEDIAKVFDKFQQIENSLNRKIGGTGLGIPIAKQLMEAHRGFIWVKSKLNEGSTFSIAIPLMNKVNIFNIDFMNAISKAKTNYSTIGFIEIKQSKTATLNIIDNILENKIDIIKKTDSTKECKIENDENVIYNVFIPEADEFLLNFVYKKLVTYLQNIDNNEKIQNIFYSQVLYPQDGLDIEELRLKANKKLSKMKITEKEVKNV